MEPAHSARENTGRHKISSTSFSLPYDGNLVLRCLINWSLECNAMYRSIDQRNRRTHGGTGAEREDLELI